MQACPFCNPAQDRVIWGTELVVALWDGFPVSPGHALLVPRRHIGTWSSASEAEQAALFNAIVDVQREIERQYEPDGYNIGINSGKAAGQTVPHLHVHIIPRFQGDVDDPRGGVRGVIPDKADYWSEGE
jgi:diadenosine tetraphosphate (Ap4A) HIT family hydrolase